MMCTIDGETFHTFTKNTWIGNSGTSCHITHNDNGHFKVTEIHELIQGSLGSLPAIKKKLCIYIQLLWLMKFCPEAGVNLLSLTCKLLQGNNITSDHQVNIVVESTKGNIILECHIKTCENWVARDKFL